MQYQDNDMDELFERAGRDYPLKTDNAGWDAVFGKLQQPDTGITTPNPRPFNKRYYWLLLLLLPLGYLTLNSNERFADKNKVPAANKIGKQENNQKQQKQITQQAISTMRPSAKTGVQESGIKLRELPISRFAPRSAAKEGREWTVPLSERSEVAKRDEGGLSSENNFDKTQSFRNVPVKYAYQKPSININVTSSSTPAPSQPKLKSIPKFYTGFIVGPDLSTIKYQQINNIGYSVGLLVGYNISRKVSVETGVFYSNKKYYTEGKYFDKAKAGIPSSVYIHDLDGGCNMFEVPVSVRYNFSTRANTLFATAGVTSYFMKKENYDYKAYTGGTYYDGYKSYKNSGNHFFANMQFSVGYNYQLSKKISLRAEPYIKVPINKIGIGNMPITSTGIYFGIIKNIK